MTDSNPSVDRFYKFGIHLVVGTRAPLTNAERRKLLREIRATLAVHMDIAGTVGNDRVTGSAYVVNVTR